VPLQRCEQDGAILFRQTGATHHDAIQSADLRLMATEAFAYHSLDPVARHSGFGDLAGNSQAQAGISKKVGAGEYGEMAVAGFDRLGEHVRKGVPASQPGAARKTGAAGHKVRAPDGHDPWRAAP